MKKSILFATLVSLSTFITLDTATASEDMKFLEESSIKIMEAKDPHTYDNKMGELTLAAKKIFNKCFPNVKLLTFEEAGKLLMNVAENSMKEYGKPEFGETWANLLSERLKGDLHHDLLPMLLHFYPTTEEQSFLLASIVPQNDSMSAIDNVWFVILVKQLQDNKCQ